MVIVTPLLNRVNVQLEEGAPSAALIDARLAALFAEFGCVRIVVLMTQVKPVPKYGTIQVVF
jgi:hypothetical protein